MSKQVNQQIRVSRHSEIFTLVKQGKGVIIVVGEYKVCEHTFNDFREAENYIATKPYKLIFNTFQIFMQYEKNKKETAQENSANK